MERKIRLKSVIISAIILIVMVLLAIFLTRTITNFILISQVSNLKNEYKESINYNNYHIKQIQYSSGDVVVNNIYYKEGTKLVTTDAYLANNSEKRSVIIYSDENNEISLLQSGEDKVALINERDSIEKNVLDSYTFFDTNFWYKLTISVFGNVEKENDSYIVEIAPDFKIWIDAKTGLNHKILKMNDVADIFFEFNNVTDEDVAKPSTEGYTIQENN